MEYQKLIASIESIIDKYCQRKNSKRKDMEEKVLKTLGTYVTEMKLSLNDYRVLLYYYSFVPEEPYKSGIVKLKEEVLVQNELSSYIEESKKEGVPIEETNKMIANTFLEAYQGDEIPFETLETALWSLDINLRKELYVSTTSQRKEGLKEYLHQK